VAGSLDSDSLDSDSLDSDSLDSLDSESLDSDSLDSEGSLDSDSEGSLDPLDPDSVDSDSVESFDGEESVVAGPRSCEAEPPVSAKAAPPLKSPAMAMASTASGFLIRLPMSSPIPFGSGPYPRCPKDPTLGGVMRAPAVVLLSGGLDSAAVAAMAVREGFDVHALSFRYGQRHAVELDAAAKVAAHLGVAEHRVVEIDLRAFGGSALTEEIAVPKDRDVDALADIPVTYVPARNTIFLSFALAFAEVIGSSSSRHSR
jgi:hypothetical protein